jgi:hypothetical protein
MRTQAIKGGYWARPKGGYWVNGVIARVPCTRSNLLLMRGLPRHPSAALSSAQDKLSKDKSSCTIKISQSIDYLSIFIRWQQLQASFTIFRIKDHG